ELMRGMPDLEGIPPEELKMPERPASREELERQVVSLRPDSERSAQHSTLSTQNSALSTPSLSTDSNGEINLVPGEPRVITAVPVNSAGETVQGLAVHWTSNNPGVVQISEAGEAIAEAPGTAVVTGVAGPSVVQVRVNVVEAQENEKWEGRQFGGKKRTSTREEQQAPDKKQISGVRNRVSDGRMVKTSFTTQHTVLLHSVLSTQYSVLLSSFPAIII
ncbi:MAG: hypothetical protein ACRD4L_09450, partial [Pyrinomonadaceae bacterium]